MTIKDVERKFISIGEASVFTGLAQETLRRWFRDGKVQGFITSGGQRRFSIESLEEICKSNKNSEIRDKKEKELKRNYIYARVSTKKQSDDLERQVKYIQEKLQQEGKEIDSYIVIRDIGSGINFNKKGLNLLLDSAMSRTIREVVVANRDRLSRFGFDLIKAVIKKGGGKLKVINDSEIKSSEQELAEDLLSIVHIFSCKQNGKRSYSNRKCKDKDVEISVQSNKESKKFI